MSACICQEGYLGSSPVAKASAHTDCDITVESNE